MIATDHNTFFIGHSTGCQTILRYLSHLREDVKVGEAILVAPWVHLNRTAFDDEGEAEIARSWLDTPINWDEIKRHPALVLLEEFDNVVIAGITSNTNMEGVPIPKKDGAVKDSVIKLNYIFTVSTKMIEKKLFALNKKKRNWYFKNLQKA